MKKIILITTILISIVPSFSSETTKRTYIVNTDGTVTFLKRMAPSVDEAGRTYIVEEDGTITFLDRVAPTELDLMILEDAREEINNTLEWMR